MQLKTNKIEFLFYPIFAIYIIACIFSLSALADHAVFSLAIKGLKYLCYLGCVIKLLLDGFSEKKIWYFIVIALFAVLITVSTGSTMYFLFFLVIMAAKNVNLVWAMKVACWVQGLCLLAIIGLSQLGIIEDYIFDPNGRVRHGLGFSWTTTGAILLFFFELTYLYLRREKAHLIEYVILELISFWLYVQTNSRMCFALSTVFMIWMYIMKYYWQNHAKQIRHNKIVIALPTIICLIAIYIHVGYNSASALWVKLNDGLSGRLQLGQSAFQKYGVPLFGQKITWVGYGMGAVVGEYNYVDCSYMQILIQYGLIALIIVIALYTFMMYVAVKQKDFYLQTILFFILVLSITEPRLLDLNFNVFPILAMSFFAVKERAAMYQDAPVWKVQTRFQMPRIRLKDRS